MNAEQLRRWIAENRANAQTRAIAEGATDWKPLALFPEFSFLVQPAPAAFPSVPPAYAPIRRTNSFAITGFILGLISATGGICCFGHLFMLLGLIFSLIGLSQIKSNPDLYEGKGLAIAGVVLSIIGFVLSIGFILFWFLASALSHTSHHSVYRL